MIRDTNIVKKRIKYRETFIAKRGKNILWKDFSCGIRDRKVINYEVLNRSIYYKCTKDFLKLVFDFTIKFNCELYSELFNIYLLAFLLGICLGSFFDPAVTYYRFVIKVVILCL